ncbi:NACHT domain-containing protein [Actinokineospora pegani]|uniref:NACHT domain-containing protein n=1 Tax=Actinokineospora pegani TaxID=2654637 RepID=UPI0012EA0D55|nr:ATP-binding protein [Actinokineospora pegani]
MARENPLTYEGALRVLGKHDDKWINRLDKVSGGLILAAGAAAVTFAPAAAAAVLVVVWGSVDQKNEFIRLLRDRVNSMKRVPAPQRHAAVLAAHSTLVAAAYFDALREFLARQRVPTDLAETVRTAHESALGRALAEQEIPAPSIERGFAENVEHVVAWFDGMNWSTADFLRVSGIWWTPGRFKIDAEERYVGYFRELVAEVPEFRVWAELGEHAATREQLRVLGDDVLGLLDSHDAALARMETFFSGIAPEATTTDLRDTVRRVNRAVLDEPIIARQSAEQYGRHLVFPRVEDIFVSPRYRFAVKRSGTSLADDKWWQERPVQEHLDLGLLAHFTSAAATRTPLLVLGHPGAGKSLLTKVLSARLPAETHTVVRVPLRYVSGDAPVHQQIQKALDDATNRRTEWADLVDQSKDTIRVVVLDGLDELLQQTHTRLYGYLQAVVDFQRTEAVQGHPVVVVVTSRTVVSDRVEVPGGTPVVKLENFDDTQIAQWLRVWHRANAAGIEGGSTQEFALDSALHQRDLTAQPLLLLMLAIYFADPDNPLVNEHMSSASVYQRLLEYFAIREAQKSGTPTPDEVDAAVHKHLRRLSTAALGMFNRGRQDITARELAADLAALDKDDIHDPGDRVLGEFFFVHSSERDMGADGEDRHYEFLHATFGEYLVAIRVLDELVDVTRAAFSGRYGMSSPADDLLSALLSHESLATRRPTLRFLEDLCGEMPAEEAHRVAKVLVTLLTEVRSRRRAETRYEPKPVDHVRHLATYSANLVLLHVALFPGQSLPLADFLAHPEGGTWESLCSLWWAGLDHVSATATFSILELVDCKLTFMDTAQFSTTINRARLSVKREQVLATRFGQALVYDEQWFQPHEDALDFALSWTMAMILGAGRIWGLPQAVGDVPPGRHTEAFARLLGVLLKARSGGLLAELTGRIVDLYLKHSPVPDPSAIAAAVAAHPELADRVPPSPRGVSG